MLMIAARKNAKESEGNEGKHHIMDEVLNLIGAGLPAESNIATTSTTFTEPTTAELLAKQSKDPLPEFRSLY